MKKVPMNKIMNENSSDLLFSILESVPELRFVTKLDDALKARGLTQGKLATLTGLRPTTISEIVNSSRLAITKTHIACIMVALRITDIREIIDIEFSPETKEQFDKERKDWLEKDIIPEGVVKIYADHAVSQFNPNIRD